jgi:hypothetical protein
MCCITSPNRDFFCRGDSLRAICWGDGNDRALGYALVALFTAGDITNLSHAETLSWELPTNGPLSGAMTRCHGSSLKEAVEI